jgi:hypothetical protein
MSADKLDFQGKDIDISAANSIDLNANEINLDANKLNWNGKNIFYHMQDDGQGGLEPSTTVNFGVDANGDIHLRNVTAETGHIGGSDGWEIYAKHLKSGTDGTDGSMHLSTEDFSYSIGTTTYSNIRLSIGSKMRVKSDGTIMAYGLVADTAEFANGFKSHNGLVEITDYEAADESYTWNGIAVRKRDGAQFFDIVTLGARYGSNGESYARAVFGRRTAGGTYGKPVVISGEDGSVTAESIKADKFHLPVKAEGSFQIPANGKRGEVYFLGHWQANGQTTIDRNGQTLLSQDGQQNTANSINLGGGSYIIVCVVDGVWRLFKCF